MKTIVEQEIKTVTGKPFKFVKEDADGKPTFKQPAAMTDDEFAAMPDKEKAEKMEPILENATSSRLIKHMVTNIPRDIQAPKDGYFAAQLMPLLEKVNGKIELDDKIYDWIQRLMRNRKMPLSKDGKDAGALPQTYGRSLYGINDYTFLRYVTDVDSVCEEPKED